MLCEAAWVLIRTPGPLRAFYERVRVPAAERRSRWSPPPGS